MPDILTSPTTRILTPRDPEWDDARRAWNLAVDQHPAAVALPACVQDVLDAIRFARAHGLRVAAQGTGHNAGPLGSLAGTILIKPTAMQRVTVDADAKVARAEADAVSRDVIEAAAEHGLAWLSGTSPDVGVVGYTIGGGISWLGEPTASRRTMSRRSRLSPPTAGSCGPMPVPSLTCSGRFAAVAAVYIRHYNEHRPHRSLDQRPPIEEPPPGSETDVDLEHVRRRDLLGGLIHEYKAAA